MRYKLFQAVSVGVLLVLIASAPNFAPESDATAKITGKSIAAGVGYSWGSGVLTYKAGTIGSALGISAGDIGVATVELSGTVSNLTNLEDFNGNYTSVSAGPLLQAEAAPRR